MNFIYNLIIKTWSNTYFESNYIIKYSKRYNFNISLYVAIIRVLKLDKRSVLHKKID